MHGTLYEKEGDFMSWLYNRGTIIMTKGDTPSFKINVNVIGEGGNVVKYEPLENDKIVFAVKKNASDSGYLFMKEIPHDSMEMTFKEEDTKDLAEGDYIYEVSLNSGDYHCTFIANKTLRLEPEVY